MDGVLDDVIGQVSLEMARSTDGLGSPSESPSVSPSGKSGSRAWQFCTSDGGLVQSVANNLVSFHPLLHT
jgi:hypothetical protein